MSWGVSRIANSSHLVIIGTAVVTEHVHLDIGKQDREAGVANAKNEHNSGLLTFWCGRTVCVHAVCMHAVHVCMQYMCVYAVHVCKWVQGMCVWMCGCMSMGACVEVCINTYTCTLHGCVVPAR